MGREALILAIKVLAGGTFVVAFSLLAEVLKPKSFSGLFSAAPSVALASLLVTALDKGPKADELYTAGMIAGSVGMVACCIVAGLATDKLGPIRASAVSWATWLLFAGTAFLVMT